MSGGFRSVWIGAVLLALAAAGCDSTAGDTGGETGDAHDLPRDARPDGDLDGTDPGGQDVAGDLVPDGTVESGGDAVQADADDAVPVADAPPMPDEGGPEDLVAGDPGSPDMPVADLGTPELPPVDEGNPEVPGTDPGPVVDTFCRSFEDCEEDEVCEFSLGVCQRRGTWKDTSIAMYGFHPAAATAGDVLVVDGTAFYLPGFIGGAPKNIRIGSVNVGGTQYLADENRILIKVTAQMQGVIQVTDMSGSKALLPTHFRQAPAGEIACDGSTPAASGVPGPDPRHVGPHAAGYVDLRDGLDTRIFYPAECGSIRRPARRGTWPLVMILHGNGANHLQHEHLAQLLATWGFVSVMPSTLQNMANQEQEALVEQVMPLVVRVRGQDLGGEHPVLAGVVTTEDVAWVGHSRGTGRSEELILADSDLAAHTKGAIFLGPVDDGEAVPGLLMVFGGGKDTQSGPSNYNGPYDDHDGPKWLITLPGGNHGSFCDHKVYGYGALGGMGDLEPTITRHKQLTVVETFGLPMMQRAFGLDEPFGDVLDSPPTDPDYTVKHEG